MTRADFEAKLLGRLLSTLQNPTVDQNALGEAVNDVYEILEGRVSPAYLMLDVGVYRYKIRQKIAPSESDEKLYDAGVKKMLSYALPQETEIQKAPVAIRYGSRESEWE